MKLFLLLLFFSFIGGLALHRHPLRQVGWMLLGLCLAISVGYWVFRMI
jgi:hypothetical protein